MTELLLVCALGALGVAFAVALGRWLLRRPAVDEGLAETAQRVASAAQRFLARQSVLAASMAALLAAVIFVVYGAAYQLGWVAMLPPRELGVCAALTVLLGAGCALGVMWSGWWATRTASARAAAAARKSLDASLQLALRSGAGAALWALSWVALGLGGLFAILYAYVRGGTPDPALALARVARLPLLMAGFVLGAACVAVLCQLAGGGFHAMADMGRNIGTPAGVASRDELQEARLADLVGDSVSDGATHGAVLFSCAALVSWAGMLAASWVFRANPGMPSATAFILYPLVIQSFALVAAWFGIVVVRTDETEAPSSALARGLYVAHLLSAVASVGVAKWLLGEHWWRLGGCAALGALGSLLVYLLLQYAGGQRHRPLRGVADAARGGSVFALLRGMLVACEGAAVLLLVAVLVGLGARWMGAGTGLRGAGMLGSAIAVGALLAAAPCALAMSNMAAILDVAGGLIEARGEAERPDVQARARVLDGLGGTAKIYTKVLVALSGGTGCLVLAAVVVSETRAGAPPASGLHLGVSAPLVQLGAVTGVITILAFGWLVLRHVLSATREVVGDLRAGRMARGGRAAASLDPLASAVLGQGRAPSSPGTDREAAKPPAAKQPHDALRTVESVARIALRGVVLPAAVGPGVPLFACLGLRLLAPGDRISAAATSMVALLIAATIVGMLGALFFLSAGSAWDNAKKYIETGAHGGRTLLGRGAGSRPQDAATEGTPKGELPNPTYRAAMVADGLGDPLKNVLAPAINTLLQTLAALALVFLPLFL